MDPCMLMEGRVLLPWAGAEGEAGGPTTPQSGAGVTFIAHATATEGDRSRTSKEATGREKLFQLKREFGSAASYKINIQNLVACQTPQNNCNKIYWKKIPFTIQQEIRNLRNKINKETDTGLETNSYLRNTNYLVNGEMWRVSGKKEIILF